MENWKVIEGTGNHYEVSDLGNVRCDGSIVPLKIEPTGYVSVKIKLVFGTRNFWLHRVVAAYFCSNPENKEQVNHIDGDKQNNKASNLEWCTNTENQHHALEVLGKTMKGKTNSHAVYCKELDRIFPSMKQAVEFLGNHACNEGIKKAILANRPYHGYKFSFIESSTTIETTSK